MAFKTSDPLIRPVSDPWSDTMGEVGLGGMKIRDCPLSLPLKLIPDKGTFVDSESKDGRVSNHRICSEKFFMHGHPIVDDCNIVFFTKTKKFIKRSSNYNIQIEEKTEAFNGQVVTK